MGRHKKYRTNIAFKRSSAIVGAGSIFSVRGNYFRFDLPKNSQEADKRAMESDWGMVGQDIIQASRNEKR